MNSDTITVGVVISIVIAVGIGYFWIWLFSRPRRRPGLPPPDRSCTRDWYIVGRDAK